MLNAHPFIKVAAVTDHDSVRANKPTIELAKAYPDILIIPGCEISTKNGETPIGDMLVLGTFELPPKPWTPEKWRTMLNQSTRFHCCPPLPHLRYGGVRT